MVLQEPIPSDDVTTISELDVTDWPEFTADVYCPICDKTEREVMVFPVRVKLFTRAHVRCQIDTEQLREPREPRDFGVFEVAEETPEEHHQRLNEELRGWVQGAEEFGV